MGYQNFKKKYLRLPNDQKRVSKSGQKSVSKTPPKTHQNQTPKKTTKTTQKLYQILSVKTHVKGVRLNRVTVFKVDSKIDHVLGHFGYTFLITFGATFVIIFGDTFLGHLAVSRIFF